jgi:hypothetical protein
VAIVLRPENTFFNTNNVRKAQQRVDEQRARLHSMIVRGFPTQAAEDLLCRHYAELRKLSAADGKTATGDNSLGNFLRR